MTQSSRPNRIAQMLAEFLEFTRYEDLLPRTAARIFYHVEEIYEYKS